MYNREHGQPSGYQGTYENRGSNREKKSNNAWKWIAGGAAGVIAAGVLAAGVGSCVNRQYQENLALTELKSKNSESIGPGQYFNLPNGAILSGDVQLLIDGKPIKFYVENGENEGAQIINLSGRTLKGYAPSFDGNGGASWITKVNPKLVDAVAEQDRQNTIAANPNFTDIKTSVITKAGTSITVHPTK